MRYSRRRAAQATRLLDWLEEELQSCLHRSGRTDGAAEASELRVLQVVIHAAESFAVEGIEQLPAELHLVAFGEAEILGNTRIPAIPSGIEKSRRISP